MPIPRVLMLTTMLSIAGTIPATARTWYVERDGSGEFASIHNAMIACSAGDTIMIGPGRYDDFHPIVAPAWTTEVIVNVRKDNLTFIGSGNTSTIIGPTVMYLPPGQVPEPMAVASVENVDARFVDIGFENAYNCVYWSFGRVEIQECRFDGFNNGMVLLNDGGGGVAQSSFFSEESLSIGLYTSWPCGSVTVFNCIFDGPIVNELGIGVNGTHDVSIQDCQFSAKSAITFAGSSGSITNCTTTEAVGQAVWATDASQIDMTGDQFHGNYASLYVNGWSVVTGSNNIFTGGADLCTIYIHSQSQVTLNNNHIFKSGEFAAKIGQYFYEIQRNDLTNNYWGSTNPDTVAEWIWDYSDDPVTRAYIDYLPLAGGPVPTESTSWGSVKSMFR